MGRMSAELRQMSLERVQYTGVPRDSLQGWGGGTMFLDTRQIVKGLQSSKYVTKWNTLLAIAGGKKIKDRLGRSAGNGGGGKKEE